MLYAGACYMSRNTLSLRAFSVVLFLVHILFIRTDPVTCDSFLWAPFSGQLSCLPRFWPAIKLSQFAVNSRRRARRMPKAVLKFLNVMRIFKLPFLFLVHMSALTFCCSHCGSRFYLVNGCFRNKLGINKPMLIKKTKHILLFIG